MTSLPNRPPQRKLFKALLGNFPLQLLPDVIQVVESGVETAVGFELQVVLVELERGSSVLDGVVSFRLYCDALEESK